MNAIHTIWREPTMTYAQAMRLLNRRRSGADINEQQVLKALELTGDYDPDQPPMDFAPLFVVEELKSNRKAA